MSTSCEAVAFSKALIYLNEDTPLRERIVQLQISRLAICRLARECPVCLWPRIREA